MNKLKKVLRGIIFLIIGFFIFQTLTYIFMPKFVDARNPVKAIMHEYYNEKPNTIDTIFIGNSEGSRAYSPVVLWNEYGITSFNFGSSYQTIQLAYYKIKEVIKYQHPKVIVLETNSFFSTKSVDETNHVLLDNFKLDDVKLKAVCDNNVKLDSRLSYLFPLLEYHTRWDKLEADDFKEPSKEEYKYLSYKGMPMLIKKIAYTGNKNYMKADNRVEEIPEQNLEYIEKIINLCKKENIKILMVEVPAPIIWNLAKNETTTEIANKYEIEFIDLNLLQEELQIDWNNDTNDGGSHLNIYGAEKVSRYIGRILQDKYNCENHKGDKKIAEDWNEVVAKYEKRKEELEKAEKVNK